MLRVVIGVVTLLVATASAFADRREADRAEAEADALARAKDYLGAAAKFREAYAADPRPGLICNVGVAYHKAQELPRAQLFLGRCLERGSSLEGDFIGVVRSTLAKLEATLKVGDYTPVDVVVEPRFATVAIETFAADETFDGGRTVWLPFGAHRVTVRAEGYAAQTVEVAARDHAILPLHVTLVRNPVAVSAEPVPAAPGGRVGSTAADPPIAPTTAPAAEASGPRLAVPLISTIATVGLAAFAFYARSQASDHADAARLALSLDAYQTEADSTRRWNTIFGVDLAVTGVAAAASGYLWYRVITSPRRPTVTPRVEASGQGASVVLDGRF